MAVWDVIVVGLGGLGTVLTHDLAARGMKVMGLDRFSPGHDRGSSHGATRVIRQAYFEDPGYVPLLLRSYERWAELEAGRSDPLYFPVGVLEIGPPDGVVVPGVLRAAEEHGLRVEALDGDQLEKRFPGFRAPSPLVGVFEADGGYLRVEECIRAWAHRSLFAGATLNVGPSVLGWREKRGKFEVETDQGVHRCKQLALCPGAWAPELLPPELGKKLVVKRKPLLWYGAGDLLHQDQGAPAWLYELPEGVFYGFPVRETGQIKLAQHSDGKKVKNPLDLDRELHSFDRAPVEQFITDYLPDVDATDLRQHAVCMYTMSPDEHFVLGAAPGHPGLWIGAGMSGHGFKLMPALGEVLAQAITGDVERIPALFDPARLA
jgi:sarcosine oxidase